ncbi:unnamed protein product [Adineta steineri]|uniref:G-protein coupled receptors family 1 profile domain-containing protein n=1 Tax=Adineta steineri TaxID=433720 RepID=A0A815EP51_9BILA|nr:unnamed protein product [Adineta steineri]
MLSERFYTINYVTSVIVSIIGLTFSLLINFIIITNRKCYTIKNILIFDLCISSLIYFILHLIGCYYGTRNDWLYSQPLCILRAYFIMVSISGITYSLLIQAISRLFFSIFYSHKFLLKKRIHWILIFFKWLICFIIGIQPLSIEHGFERIREHRMCRIKTNKLSIAPYSICIVYVFPRRIVIIVYARIFYQVHQSTHRARSNLIKIYTSACICLTFICKNLIVMKNILTILNILMCGETPYLILMIWDLIDSGSAPRQLYFLSVNSLVSATTLLAI